MNKTTNSQHYDMVIVGGAMSGCCLALRIAQQLPHFHIAIIEHQNIQQHQNSGFDARSIALSQGSCQKLHHIAYDERQSLWQKVEEIASSIQHIHVSDHGHSGLVSFSAKEANLAHLGVVIELSRMGQLLLTTIDRCPNIDYLAPTQITHIHRNDEQIHIELNNGKLLTTPLLVGANGTNSTLAQQCGIHCHTQHEYQQTALIANIECEFDHQQTAFERFTNEGPLALLPLGKKRFSLVWCVHSDNALALMAMDDESFLAALQQRFGWRMGRLLQVSQRHSYPLKLQLAERTIHHRFVVIGNAAQTLHPIAGQGFNLGLRDVFDLATVITQAVQQQQDIGQYQVLAQYQEARKADRYRTIQLTDNLVTIFANDLLPLQLGRTLGLNLLASCRQLRQHFIKPTLGWKV